MILVATLGISISLNSEEVFAAEGDEGCCILTESGQYCASGVPESECVVDEGHPYYPETSCDAASVDQCRLGTCVESGGSCSAQKSQKECQEDPGASWYSLPLSQVDECSSGCCELQRDGETVISSQMPYKAECTLMANDLEMDSYFYEGECAVIPETTGCCITDLSCQETTQSACTGEFSLDACNSLPAQCTCIAGAYNGCRDGDVYSFNSCGEATELVSDCVLNEEMCVEEFGDATCEPITCDIPILYTTLNYDTANLKSGMVGVQKNLEDLIYRNQVKADGSVTIQLGNSERVCVQYQGPGEGHYVYTCTLGELSPANVGDGRESICEFDKEKDKVVIRENNYAQCLGCADGSSRDNTAISWFNRLVELAGMDALSTEFWDYWLLEGPGRCDQAASCSAQGDCMKTEGYWQGGFCVPKYPLDSGSECSAFSNSKSGSPYSDTDDLRVGCQSVGSCDIGVSKKMNFFGGITICSAQVILGELTDIATDFIGSNLINLAGGSIEGQAAEQQEAVAEFQDTRAGFVDQLKNSGGEVWDMARDIGSYLNPFKLIRLAGDIPGVSFVYNSLLGETRDYFGYIGGDVDGELAEALSDAEPDDIFDIEDIQGYLDDIEVGHTIELVPNSFEGLGGTYLVLEDGFSIPLEYSVDTLDYGQTVELYNHLSGSGRTPYYGYKYYPEMVDQTKSNWDATKSALKEMWGADNLWETFVNALQSAGAAIVMNVFAEWLLEDRVDLNKFSPGYWSKWAVCRIVQVGTGGTIPHSACMNSDRAVAFGSCFLVNTINVGRDGFIGTCGYEDLRRAGYENCYLCNEDPNRVCTIERCQGLGKDCVLDLAGVCKVDPEVLRQCASVADDPMTITSGIQDYDIDWDNVYYDVNITTSKFAECRFTDNPDLPYEERDIFQEADDAGLRHSASVYVGDPSRDNYNYYISCKFMCQNVEIPQYVEPFNSQITITREPKPDLEGPEIIKQNPSPFQILESRDSVTMWVEGDEAMSCKYGKAELSGDLDESAAIFADAAAGMGTDGEINDYLDDNTPFGALINGGTDMDCSQGNVCEVQIDVESGEEYLYNIVCEDLQGNPARNKLIYFKVSDVFDVEVISPIDGSTSSSHIEEIKAASSRDTECKYSFGEKLNYGEMSSFITTGGKAHITQLPEPLRSKSDTYKLFVSCLDFEGMNLATGTSDFRIEPDLIDPRLIRIASVGGKLKIELDEDSSCTYSENGFGDEQIPMISFGGTGGFAREFSLQISGANRYYISCKDNDENLGTYVIYP